ncbi:MAG: single-stranded-DNA-specific exonuclease RecJ, partial [Chloroflexi bacterium]|nr:single-stranded-DNA-specific exonuclease RecJ [Chloroflexota bacterium]
MNGLTPRYRWVLPSPIGPSADLRAAGSRRGLSANLLAVLCRRGHRDEAALGALFDDPASGLHDPHLLPDARPFLDRIELARERGERILVCGDFDADGLTGLAILVRALRMLGLDAAPYVPDRSAEGHGLSVAAVERAGAEDR